MDIRERPMYHVIDWDLTTPPVRNGPRFTVVEVWPGPVTDEIRRATVATSSDRAIADHYRMDACNAHGLPIG